MDTIEGIDIEMLEDFGANIGWDIEEVVDHVGFTIKLVEQYQKVEEIMKGEAN